MSEFSGLLMDTKAGQRRHIFSAWCYDCGVEIVLDRDKFWMRTTGDDGETIFMHSHCRERQGV